MKTTLIKILAGLLLGCLALLIQWVDLGGRYLNLPGLLWVLLGPLALAALAHSTPTVVTLMRELPRKIRNMPPVDPQELQIFLHVVELHRTGNARGAEQAAKRLEDPLWRQGVELVIQRTPLDDLTRLLQWKTASIREQYHEEIRIIKTLGAFAPAFGMLGTLMGLIDMMYALDANNLGKIGTAMGFAMLTTAYGLALANLVFKPIASRLENRCKTHVSRQQVQIETIRMLHERSHPGLVRDYWQAFQSPSQTVGESTQPAAPVLRLVKASS